MKEIKYIVPINYSMTGFNFRTQLVNPVKHRLKFIQETESNRLIGEDDDGDKWEILWKNQCKVVTESQPSNLSKFWAKVKRMFKNG